ncbi:MAG: tetratricopeptide repeat protein [Candidatus Omnitrophica bacterium]|nr:tetratricopeptide repeat protein [Candidatus Omnitrophota bacterium]
MKKLTAVTLAILLAANSLAQANNLSAVSFIKKINVLFLKEDYSGLIKNAESNLSRYKLDRNEKSEVLYLTGLSYIKLSNFSKARDSFNNILKTRGNALKQDAHIGIADSYFYGKNFTKAIKAYKDVLNKYPQSDRLSGVYYNLGLSYKAKKDFDKANYYFKQVKSRYGKSFEAEKVVYLQAAKNGVRHYIVQLVALKSLKKAKKLVRRLARKKYDSYIQKIKKGRVTLYRVRAGKFSNKYYATRLQRKLRRDGFSAKIIVE